MRADARRNYDRLLAQARELFGQEGPDAPMEEIARRAGVGIGTLYRHFPTRQALQEAVYRDQIELLAAEAEELASLPDQGEALVRWLRSTMSHAAAKRGLNTALVATLGRESELFATCRDMLYRAAGLLLGNAQKAEAVREDLDVAELFKVIHALSVATEQSPELADRMITLFIEGLGSR
jgi:AcrR family transcriptional regulator